MARVPLFPLFLKLEGERCLVVGGGPIAAGKARDLLACGPRLTVVAKVVSDQMREVVAEVPEQVALQERAFRDEDAAGMRVIVAATDDEEVNRHIYAVGRDAGALVNVVDVVELCDFYTGGVVRRGPLQVVVGTSGASPSLARRVRLWLDEQLPGGLALLGEALGDARPELLRHYPVFKERAKVLDAFVRRAVERVQRGDDAAAAPIWIRDELLAPVEKETRE